MPNSTDGARRKSSSKLSENDTTSVRRAFPSGSPFDNIVAVFTTGHVRESGLSYRKLGEGPNASHSDDCVPRNRKAVFDALRHCAANLDLESFTAAKQVHGDRVCRVTEAERGRGAHSHKDAIPATDALITDLPGVPIGVFTADCVPVFLYDPVRPAVGIAHAGWRGTVQSIAKSTAERMREEFGSNAADMWASIGPSIGPCCYEVGIDVHREFWERFHYAAPLFRKTFEQKWHLDLWLANRRQLEECGLDAGRIIESRICSACKSHEYYSARKHGPGAGRTLSAIGLKKPAG